eukprot:2494515-Pyramimonas_sp.AAC.1
MWRDPPLRCAPEGSERALAAVEGLRRSGLVLPVCSARANDLTVCNARANDLTVCSASANDLTALAGGVATTLVKSGHQWDFPNAWPPLQHMLVEGLARNYTEGCINLRAA